MGALLRVPSGRAVLLADVLLALYVLVWIALGVVLAETVKELTSLSDGLGSVGAAIDDTGGAIATLGVPLVGGAFDAAGAQISEAGRAVVGRGAESRDTIERVANLLGLAVAVIPSLPLAILYLPGRLARSREVSALRGAIEAGRGDPLLERFLARRAAQNLSYRRLMKITPRPWHDVEHGPWGPLAAEELKRLGLSARRLEGDEPPDGAV